MKVLLVHPGASWSTADVYNGLRFGLNAQGVKTAAYNLDARIARSAMWLRWNWIKNGKSGDRPTPADGIYHAGSGVLERALRLEPDWVLVVSGMYFHVDLFRMLKRAGFKVALLLTESPYDDDAQREVVKLVDIAWTNERTSVERLRAGNPNVFYLPHAWHPVNHKPSSPVELEDVTFHEVLMVGTGFPERVALLRDVDWTGIDLALYGQWKALGSRNALRRAVRGAVIENVDAAKLYQRARINLNMHRTWKGVTADGTRVVTGAESMNPRGWELAALGAFFISDPRPELTETFGDLVPTYTSAAELGDLIRKASSALRSTAYAAEVGAALRECVQEHSWVARAEQVMADIEQFEDRRLVESWATTPDGTRRNKPRLITPSRI